MLTPLATLSNPAQYEALKRFIGWSLVLDGLGYTIAWIIFPFDTAVALLGSSLLIAFGRCFWDRRRA